MQDALLIFISANKSSGLCCGIGWRAAAVGGGREEGGRREEGGGGYSASIQGSLVSRVLLTRSHDAMSHHMNIYERKLLQLRQFISSSKSCGAAQKVIVSHGGLDGSGFEPNMANSDCHRLTSTA